MNLRRALLFAVALGAARLAAGDAAPPAAAPTPAAAPATAPAPARRDRTDRPDRGTRAAPAPARTDSAVAPAAGFDDFRLVVDRNIFNPNRTGRRERTTEEVAPRLDVISLVGTMDSEKGLYAFFDGSESAYRKALRVGESVEKFKVVKIAGDTVDLDQGGKPLSMRVAQQLRRPDGADWTLVGADLARAEAAARAAAAARSDPSAPAAIPDNISELEKRLRERRNSTLKQ